MSDDNSREQATDSLNNLSGHNLQMAAAWLARLASGDGALGGSISRLLALRFNEAEEGRCVAELDVGPEMWNPLGYLHGSIPHAMIDTTMGCAVASLAGVVRQSTIEIKTNYLRPFKAGRLTVESKVIRQGKRVWFLESQVTDDQGQLITTASASFYVST